MSFHFSPRVVRDSSLILYLDAANLRSYSGDSQLTNLSGEKITGTLNGPSGGTPTYNSSNGGYLTLDGVDDYISMTNSTSLRIANPTVSMWLKPNTTNKDQFIFDGAYYLSGEGYLLYANSTNNFQFWVRNSANNTQGVGVRTATSTTVFNTSTWYNVTGTFDGSNVAIYVNGALENSAGMTYSIKYDSNSVNFWIGDYATAPGTLNFNGNVSNILIYNRVLSPSEILQNYNAIKSRFGL